jgi:hypothetical protein
MKYNLDLITKELKSNRDLVTCPGLFFGKMGLAIYFFNYARFSQKKYFEDTAFELIEAIRSVINDNTPVDYCTGLSGIGAGIEYLAQNGFIKAQVDAILKDIDSKIFQSIVYTDSSDLSLQTGLSGLGRYLLFRVNSPMSSLEKKESLTNRMLLVHLIDKLEALLLENISLKDEYDAYYFLTEVQLKKIYPTKVDKLIKKNWNNQEKQKRKTHFSIHLCENNQFNGNYSFYNGLTHLGLQLLSIESKENQTWQSLL